MPRISLPKFTPSLSIMRCTSASSSLSPAVERPYSMASFTRCSYCGMSAAFLSRLGFVVASCGRRRRMASMSPVSATITVMDLSSSSCDAFVRARLVGGEVLSSRPLSCMFSVSMAAGGGVRAALRRCGVRESLASAPGLQASGFGSGSAALRGRCRGRRRGERRG